MLLEQEVRTKDRIVRELQRQVTELEGLLERLESEIYEERSSKVRLMAPRRSLNGVLETSTFLYGLVYINII